jgi:hypothetical protein
MRVGNDWLRFFLIHNFYCAKIDIQRSANGGKGKVAAEEITVIIYMLLLFMIVDNKIRHTKISHVLD